MPVETMIIRTTTTTEKVVKWLVPSAEERQGDESQSSTQVGIIV